MTDEIDMRAVHLSGRNERFEHGVSALSGAFFWEQTEPCRHTVDMGINWEGRMPTGKKQDTSNGFGADAGKFGQECARCRHGHIHEEIQIQTPIACLNSL